MSKMGWKLPLGFEESLRNTITWTLANPQWLNLKKWADHPESSKQTRQIQNLTDIIGLIYLGLFDEHVNALPSAFFAVQLDPV